MARGSFIVLEGSDGSGKATQLQLLAKQLSQAGHEVAIFDFPQYDLPSSYFVKRYLNGDYGNARDVGPYTGALFYALDRYDVAEKIRRALDDGKVVLANRYTASSMAHQGAKFDNAEQRRGYFIWLDNLEFETLKIPRPDLNIVLRVPAEIAQTLVDKKDTRSYTDKKRDLHETDLDHLRLAVSVYDDLCQLFPKDFTRIDCVRGGELLSTETVQKLVAEKVAPLLPEPKPKQASAAIELPLVVDHSTDPKPKKASEDKPDRDKQSKLFRPTGLDPKSLRAHHDSLKQLEKHHQELLSALTAFLNEQHSSQDGEIVKNHQQLAAIVAAAVKPVAQQPDAVVGTINPAARSLHDSLTAASHAAGTDSIVSLIDIAPRNELDIVPRLLYPHSNLPYRDLLAIANDWSYEQKAKALTLFLNDKPPTDSASPILQAARYTWEIVSDYNLFLELYRLGVGSDFVWQQLTPRLGFEVPNIIDDAGLTEQYEECFDISLRLHSQLQMKGYDKQAQYATLLGHKLRWSVSYTAAELPEVWQQLETLQATPAAEPILQAMQDKLSETHPLIAESLISKTS